MLKWYYESLSKTVTLLGSNPDALFTFDDLKQELKQSGNVIPILVPMILEIVQIDSNDLNLDEALDRDYRLNEQGQREYVRQMNDVFEDMIRFGYYRKVN